MDTTVQKPAEELRAAANKLRETAKNATPGPWTAEHPSWAGDNAVLSYATNGHAVAVCGEEIKGANHPASADATWIALVHPALAGPAAELFEHIADDMQDCAAREVHLGPNARHATVVLDDRDQMYHDWTAALAAARVILGGAR